MDREPSRELRRRARTGLSTRLDIAGMNVAFRWNGFEIYLTDPITQNKTKPKSRTNISHTLLNISLKGISRWCLAAIAWWSATKSSVCGNVKQSVESFRN